jgi:hypothetical protein
MVSMRTIKIYACLKLIPSRYVSQGRETEAKEILVKYHGDGDPDSLVVNLEMQEMLEVIDLEGSDKRFWDFRCLFNTRAARYRTFLVTCIAWFAELDLPPTSYYFPLMGNLKSPQSLSILLTH